jgi:glycosyltransferase involved in cell wall biosynthesis
VTDRRDDGLTVSVALCTYQGVRHLEAQLTSILDQTRAPDEVVIADDASVDCTVQVLTDLAAAAMRRSPPVLVDVQVNPSNLGFIANFEQVLGRCRGDVIFLSDQDDVWLEDKIAAMLEPFRTDPRVGLVYCDAELVGPDLQPLGLTLFGARRGMGLSRERGPRDVVRQVGINGCTMALRRELLDWLLPIPATWGHDHWIALLAHALGRVRPVERPLVQYRRYPGTAGDDPLLDGGRIRLWTKGVRRSGIDAYAADLERWRDMSRRMDHLSTLKDGAPPHAGELATWAAECRQRMAFAEARLAIKRTSRGRRLGPWLRLVRSGGHGRYLSGWGSALKDLVL